VSADRFRVRVRLRRFTVSVVIALAVGLGTAPAWGADPPSLEELAAAIDRASKEPDGERVVAGHLSRKLGVSVETLRSQRVQTGLDWGQLFIANLLSRRAGVTLDQVAAELLGGKSWKDIAGGRVDLARLTSDVQQSEEAIEQRGEDKGPHGDLGKGPNRQTPGAGMGRGRRY
jgi:hypothetical protein